MGSKSMPLMLIPPLSAGNGTPANMRCTRSAEYRLTISPPKNKRGIMAKKNDPEYPVGYGKPPKHTQFRPGQSGNPHGRPAENRTFEDDVETEMRVQITALEDGKRRKLTKRRAIVKQLINKALGGDARATELLL